MRLFVSNLDYTTRVDDLREFFVRHGYPPDASEEGVKIIRDRDTGESRGFGFIELSEVLDGQKAIKELDGQILDGRHLNIKPAEGPKPKAGGGRGRGYRD